MTTQNLFENDWRECLSAHYFHVIKERDVNNEESLISVLIQTGFTEYEIDALRTQTLIALGWYDPDAPVQEATPADSISDEIEVEMDMETAVEPVIEAPAERLAEVPFESEVEPQSADLASDTLDEPEIDAKRSTKIPPKNKPPKDEPPVQMSMF